MPSSFGSRSPAGAAGMEPAVLVGLAVEVRVDVAIDLQAVLVIAPLVHHVVVVGVDELPQDHALGTLDDPAHVAVDLLGDDLALGRFLRAGPVVIDARLNRREFQRLFGRRRGGPSRGGKQ